MSPRFTQQLLKILFTTIGIGMIAGALWAGYSTRTFLADAARAEGVVLDFEQHRSSDSTRYSPVVRFTARDGREITFVSSWSSNRRGMAHGETVTVLYPPASPADARIERFFDLWGLSAILGGIGVVFLGFGVGFILADVHARRRARDLKLNGRLIQADVQGVERSTGLSVNGQTPYRIRCQWQDPATGDVHVFASENLWYDPTAFITSQQIGVRIDPKRPSRYWVDVSALPELAG